MIRTLCIIQGVSLRILVFADDLIIFSKGEKKPIQLILRGLATFVAASGLTTSAGKSNIYDCNMDPQVKKQVLEMTEFKEDTLPFKYLGMQISTKKMSID